MTYDTKRFIIAYRELLSIRKTKWREKIMKLKEGKNQHIYKVKAINMELNLERRLEALGLTADTKITVLNNDRKGALTVRFRGTRFAMGQRIADNIEVEEAKA